MLDWLRVSNLVLIRSAELDLASGLNVITGETGAGKTILAQALGLLAGGRADAALVGPAADDTYVEAGFSDVTVRELPAAFAELAPEGEDGLVLARRVTADGRSRALAWGRACARADLEAAAASLVEIVSQHEARRLARPAVQLDLLDAAAGADAKRLRDEMAARWQSLGGARAALEEATGGAAERERELAELAALAEAVEAAGPLDGVVVALRAERARLRNLDELLADVAAAAERVNPGDGEGALSLAGRARAHVEQAAGLDAALEPIAAELADACERLREAALALRAYADGLDAPPARLEQVEARLQLFADLRHRFDAPDLATLRARAASARAALDAAAGGPGAVARLEREAERAEAAARETAAELGRLRRERAPLLARAVEEHLTELGMESAVVEPVLGPRPLGVRGEDSLELRLRANPGLPAQPLARAASGGELSRVSLALRLAARDPGARETLVFDEVDAGIGGGTARALGEKLRRLADDAQIVCITHLPQVAALAHRHFRVVKTPGEPSETRIERLEGAEVDAEIVRMLGAEPGDADALALAASLRSR
jgi:DNA repair protein RecN (Recombination protein N)